MLLQAQPRELTVAKMSGRAGFSVDGTSRIVFDRKNETATIYEKTESTQKTSCGVYVTVVHANTPAAAAGLEIGDQILKINDINVSRSSPNEIENLIQRSPTLELQVIYVPDAAGAIAAALGPAAGTSTATQRDGPITTPPPPPPPPAGDDDAAGNNEGGGRARPQNPAIVIDPNAAIGRWSWNTKQLDFVDSVRVMRRRRKSLLAQGIDDSSESLQEWYGVLFCIIVCVLSSPKCCTQPTQPRTCGKTPERDRLQTRGPCSLAEM